MRGTNTVIQSEQKILSEGQMARSYRRNPYVSPFKLFQAASQLCSVDYRNGCLGFQSAAHHIKFAIENEFVDAPETWNDLPMAFAEAIFQLTFIQLNKAYNDKQYQMELEVFEAAIKAEMRKLGLKVKA